MSKWIIVWGNPIDGLTFTGPFDHYNDALAVVEFERDAQYNLAIIDEPEGVN